MKYITKTIVLLAAIVVFLGCKKNNSDSTSGKVTGKILTEGGAPVQGAKVLIASTVYYDSNVSALTGADGTYSKEIPLAENDAWYTYASITKEYNGKTYTMDLHPDNTNDFLAKDGAVRNFTWKLTGNQVGRSTGVYGGIITIGSEIGEFYDYSNVTLTLVPVGSLIDGSTGSTIVKQIDNTQKIEVPIGRYTISAKYNVTNAVMKIRQSNVGAYANSVTLDFTPQTDLCKNCITVDIKL